MASRIQCPHVMNLSATGSAPASDILYIMQMSNGSQVGKSLEQIAMLLIARPARTSAGKVVHSALLARIEALIASGKK